MARASHGEWTVRHRNSSLRFERFGSWEIGVLGLLRRFRLVLVVGGTALSVVSTLGLILDWGSHSARRPAAAASTTSTVSTAPTASTAASPRSEAPQAFFDRFVAAVR